MVGNGARELPGDGGPALNAGLKNPADVTFDGAGNMSIADHLGRRSSRPDDDGLRAPGQCNLSDLMVSSFHVLGRASDVQPRAK